MYLGRVVGLGLNEDGNPFAIYAVSGRSEGSRARKAEIKDNIVEIGPIGDISPEQEKMKDLIFYPAIIAKNEERYVIVSNGIQTKYMFEETGVGYRNIFNLIPDGFEKAGGVEPDDYGTPRIGGFLNILHERNPSGGLGIITKEKTGVSDVNFERGKVKYVSTYKGDPDNPENVIIPEYYDIPAGKLELSGENAQELADKLYDWMDSNLVVCSAVALWLPDENKWELARKNLHE
ncbi:MAG: IMP cyclohydrolase [Nanoarchaeota archaeon]|nr:IMP cyclohydrolase [Nanoarchaeota archaeon]MBU1135438.1 IMP cyclohydrolase [Nanoarchaeota archaeon]MBU2519680.1 IMP cyclohydrolase [Nanoarchaeota archaeon]